MKALLLCLLAVPGFLNAEETVLSNFENQSIPNIYGSWLDPTTGHVNVEKTADGLQTTAGATAKGGGSAAKSPILASGESVIQLTLSVLAGNEAGGVNVLLQDASGTQGGWRFSTSGMKVGESKTLTSKPLLSPEFTNPPNATLDLGAITAWHVQGDFSNDAALRVRFEKLSLAPAN